MGESRVLKSTSLLADPTNGRDCTAVFGVLSLSYSSVVCNARVVTNGASFRKNVWRSK